MNQYEQAAIEALRAWHRVAASEFPANMKLSFDEFLAYVRTKNTDQMNWLVEFGKSVISTSKLTGVGMANVHQSMEKLARESQGRVTQYPDGYPRLQEFFDALMNRSLMWDVSVIKALAQKTAVEGLEAAATAGKWVVGGYGLVLALGAAAGLYVTLSSWKKR